MPRPSSGSRGEIGAGDIFHASAPNDASMICLALKVDETTILARAVTSQREYSFDRLSGAADREGVRCTIDSTAALPPEVHQALLGLDRIYSAEASGESHPLTESEKRALVFAAQYSRKDPEAYDQLTAEEKVELILLNYLIPAGNAPPRFSR